VSTITATADSTKSQVRLDLDFSDIDAPYAYVTRVDPTTGAPTAVRGHGASTTIAGLPYVSLQAGYKAVLYDTEAPLDQAFYYVATAPLVTMNATATFEGGYPEPWYGPAPTVSVDVTQSRSGASFLAIQTDGTFNTPQMHAEDIPATPNAVFTITAVVSSNVSQSITVGLSALDATGTSLLSVTTNNPTVLASATIVATITCPASTVAVRPVLAIIGTPAATSIASFASVAVVSAAGSATSGGVTLASLGSCRLKDPLRPGSNVRVDFAFDPNPLCTPSEGIFWQSLDVEERGANAATFNINNQVNAAVVSKVRSSVTSTLTLVSRTFADRDRLDVLLAPGSPLLFQAPDEYGLPDRYLSVGNESTGRVLPDHRIPIRVFSLPHVVVSAPGGPMQGTVGARWSDTCNRYATWGAVNAAALTWTQVLDGLAG
jgi:hypothetical protein